MPVQLLGEAARGTLVMHEHDTLAINADALQLPDHLEASIEGLEAGSHVTAADVKLPAGVELAADPEPDHRRRLARADRRAARGRGRRRGGRGRGWGPAEGEAEAAAEPTERPPPSRSVLSLSFADLG